MKCSQFFGVVVLVFGLGLSPLAAQDSAEKTSAKTVDEHAAKLCAAQYRRRNFSRALKNCVKGARSGDLRSHVVLGYMYWHGFPTVGTRDPVRYPEMAYKVFLKAAEMGHAQSHYYIGQLLEAGVGVEKDAQAAWEWKQKALELGFKPTEEHTLPL